MSENIIHSGKCGSCSWNIDNNGELRIYPTYGEDGLLENFELSGLTSNAPWAKYSNEIKSVVATKGVFANQSTSGMFFNLANCEKMDLAGLNTYNTTDMTCMFSSCSSLISLDLSSFNTSNVSNMDGMFEFCKSLKSLNLQGFDTTDVLSMNSMFLYCENLEELVFTKFNTSRVKDMGNMFACCGKIREINVSE